MDVWKGFAQTQIRMFQDSNMFGLGVLYLFGTTPFTMMQMQGEISTVIDDRSLEILKSKPAGKRLCFSPAQHTLSDANYKARLQDMHQ